MELISARDNRYVTISRETSGVCEVDLVEGKGTCPSAQYRNPSCKHAKFAYEMSKIYFAPQVKSVFTKEDLFG